MINNANSIPPEAFRINRPATGQDYGPGPETSAWYNVRCCGSILKGLLLLLPRVVTQLGDVLDPPLKQHRVLVHPLEGVHMGVEDLADLLELRSGKDEEKRLQQRVSSEEPRSKERRSLG